MKKINAPKTRKELRKEQRKLKKARKNEFFQRKKNPLKLAVVNNDIPIEKKNRMSKNPSGPTETKQPAVNGEVKRMQKNMQEQHTEIKQPSVRDEVKNLQKDMQKQRIKQLIRANKDEDKEIKKLEKQLKLNKRKSKSVPKSFAEDGLDCILL